MGNHLIYQRLKEFSKDFQKTECPFGNSGTFYGDDERDKIEKGRREKFFFKYGKCRGLCVRLEFSEYSCPCFEHGADKSLKILKKWLRSWEKTHPGEIATTRSGKPKRNDTTTKTPKTTIKATKGTPKKK